MMHAITSAINPQENNTILYVFIDASNLWQAQKVKGKMFDYEKLKKFLKSEFNASQIEIFYYTAYPASGMRDYDLTKRHDFFTYLKKGLKFNVIKKELKVIVTHTELGDSKKEKGNMDVEMTIDAIHHIEKYDTAVFFTGDSDFLPLITYIKNRGKKVYVYSSENNVSKELRTGADGYVDVLKLDDNAIWGRDLRHRESTK